LKVEVLNLHGHNLQEARLKIDQNLDWLIKKGIDVLVINHGKGYHSNNNVAVLKSETRKLLKANSLLASSGYSVIYGESDVPVALSYDEGHTLVVAKGLEHQYIGGKAQQEKNLHIFSEDGKAARKSGKNIRKQQKHR
jgi:hypothetical protein